MRTAGPERLLGIILVLALAAALVAFAALQPAVPDETEAGDGGPDGPTETGEVVRVVDGDTVVVRIDGRDERVRYIGLDAPEVANIGAGVVPECGGDVAREINEELVAGERLVLERDVSDRDRFGRLLRHAWLEGDSWRLVGRELVEVGAVEARSYPPDTTRDPELDAAERTARDRDAGIWGTCP
jgi:micrococcal nuclease